MAYEYFDKKFLLFPDDEECPVGDRVFYADDWNELISDVESGDIKCAGTLLSTDSDRVYPFDVAGTHWRFAYYDPAYEARVAYSQGKTIEYRSNEDIGDGMWRVSTMGVVDPKHYDYRVKPDSKWFVHGMAGGKFYKDKSSDVYVKFEGTEEECDVWIAEHTFKTRRMTNRELAKWCADNKGQWGNAGDARCYHAYSYISGDNTEIPDSIKLREWNSDQWHEPLVKVEE